MSRPDHEPLSPEERALAERLARLGPHDGPSPALDAKILAAAHAAVAPKRRRRWLGLTAVPGSLITGAGMAAALVVVVGVVWQLRPSSPTPHLPREEGDMGYVSAEILERAPSAPPPPPPPMESPEPARAQQAPAVARAPARKQEAPVAASIAAQDDHYVDEAIVHAPAADAAASGAAAPAPYAAPVFAPTPSPAFAPPPPAPIAQAAAEAEAREDMARRQVGSESASRERSEAAATASAKRAAVASESASPTLHRVDVSGTRLAGVPVDEDLDLPPDEWIERIRARRDDGDLDGARESLKRLREAHPRVRVPRDLRELAAPAR